MKSCNWCENSFKPTVSYQIYCSTKCRDEATREKIVERHKVLKRKKRRDKIRFCAGACGTKLSIYNDDVMCNSCSINSKQVDKKIKEIRMLMHDYEDKRT